MKPGKLDLPPIWRGCDYGTIILIWLDNSGNPVDYTGWTPSATSKQIDFHPVPSDPPNGVTLISLSKFETSALKLGVEQWDWIWTNEDGTRLPPFLAGSVPIKEPTTQVTFGGPTPPTPVPPSPTIDVPVIEHSGLRAIDTVGTTLGTIRHMVRLIGGLWVGSDWYSRAGTDADDDDVILRPHDYNPITNARVWVKIFGL